MRFKGSKRLIFAFWKKACVFFGLELKRAYRGLKWLLGLFDFLRGWGVPQD